MPRQKQNKARLSVSVTPQQKVVLEDMARRNEVSVTRVIQEAIKEFISRHPNHQLPLFDRLDESPGD
jgi:hypothetical protein